MVALLTTPFVPQGRATEDLGIRDMANFDSDWLKRFQRLRLSQRPAGSPVLLRQPRGPVYSRGTEVVGLRDYVPGDDYRSIDWRLCARRDELMSKKFCGEPDPRVYLLVDCSQSMSLGHPSKFAAAVEATALLGGLALYGQTRVGLTAFSGRPATEFAPRYGKHHFGSLLRFLEHLTLDDAPSDLARVAKRFSARAQRPGPVVVISDLLDAAGWSRAIDALRRRGYTPRIVHIYAQEEAEPQLLGDVELFDVERHVGLETTVTQRTLRRYRATFAAFLASVESYCARWTIPYVRVRAETETLADELAACSEITR